MPDVEHIARICHEANRKLQLFFSDPAPSPEWDDAPQWQKTSAITGVELALAGATPEDLHKSWCDTKIAEGWRFGQTKDAEKKTHPCLVDYDLLPMDQRLKDHIFFAIVNSYTAGGPQS